MKVDNFTIDIKSQLELDEGNDEFIEINIIDNTDMKKYCSIINIHKDLKNIPDFLRSSETIIRMINSSFKKENNMLCSIIKNDNVIYLKFIFNCYFNTIQFIIKAEQVVENDINRVDRVISKLIKRIEILEKKLEDKEEKTNSFGESEQHLKSLLPYGQAKEDILFIVTILHTYLLQDFINKNRDIFKDYFTSTESLNNHCYHPATYTTFKMNSIDILLIDEKTTQKLYYENFVRTWISVINGLINNYIDITEWDKANYTGCEIQTNQTFFF